jgi:hypothetical protein
MEHRIGPGVVTHQVVRRGGEETGPVLGVRVRRALNQRDGPVQRGRHVAGRHRQPCLGQSVLCGRIGTGEAHDQIPGVPGSRQVAAFLVRGGHRPRQRDPVHHRNARMAGQLQGVPV